MGILKNNATKVLYNAQKPLWNPGIYAGLEFDGINDYLNFGTVSEFDGTNWNHDVITGDDVNQELTWHFVGVMGAAGFGGVEFYINDENKFAYFLNGSNVVVQFRTGGSSNNLQYLERNNLTNNELFSMTCVINKTQDGRRASDMAFYKNYKLNDGDSFVNDTYTNNINWAGNNEITNARTLCGSISIYFQDGIWYQALAFDKALSPAEISSLQHIGLFAKIPAALYPNVMANWDFSNRYGAKVRDTVGLYNATYPAHHGAAKNMQTGLGADNQWVDLSGNPILR